MCDSAVTEALREADVVAALHRLNALYIGALAEADETWLREHLSDDFVCTLSDGRRVGKLEYLRRIEQGPRARGAGFDEVDVRPLGGVAVVQGVMHSGSRRSCESERYTHVWRLHDGSWRAVVAHSTRLGGA